MPHRPCDGTHGESGVVTAQQDWRSRGLRLHNSPGRRLLRRHWLLGAPALIILAAVLGQAVGEVLVLAVLGPVLLALMLYDVRYLILPDALVALVLVTGLGGALAGIALAPTPVAAAVGVAVGGSALWAVRALYARMRGVVGLGWGDVKLFAAAGAWVGWQGLADLLLIACLASLGAIAVARVRGGGRGPQGRLPFGPSLAIALYVMVVRAGI